MIYPICLYGNSVLKIKAAKVKKDEVDVIKLSDDMFETMYESQGVGLAATQINVHKQIIVIDTSEEKDSPLCFINPKLIETLDEEETDEGCLSVPGIFEPIKRAKKITVQALDKEGKSFELEADGLLGVCIQHEIDHLKGILFVDYLSPLKRERIKKKMVKRHKTR